MNGREKWKQVKGVIKERWGKLTDDDLDVIAGQRDQLAGRIQERYVSQGRRLANKWTNGCGRRILKLTLRKHAKQADMLVALGSRVFGSPTLQRLGNTVLTV